MPSLTGSSRDAAFSYAGRNPRRRLGDLVTPLDDDGDLDDEAGSFVLPGASTIYREEGQRLIALKFSVEGRDLGSTVAEAQAAIAPLIEAPFHVEWSGEFEQMEEAERRLMLVVPLSFGLCRHHVVPCLSFGTRCRHRPRQCFNTYLRWCPWLAIGWHELQRLGSRWIHLDFWSGYHERLDIGFIYSPVAATRTVARGSCDGGSHQSFTSYVDDDSNSNFGLITRRRVDSHWRISRSNRWLSW